MSNANFETLDITGCNVTETSINYEKTMLAADFGSGYRATAIVGLSLREWALQIDVLPDMEEYSIEAGEHGLQTRANYLWEFYCRQMDAGCRPFWLRDQKDSRSYLVEFVDLKLTYQVLTSIIYSTGLQLRQRRVAGVEGVASVTDVVNPDSI